ncbi:acyl-CoA dehydrogenase family protein [Achromobacter seleniivolatilans]|uniref:Acyl-CoA dehydrogenase family protein n=1 Tax=Achromobacter seleniivolatilans TaxID=3047478 RepID=A0ABY9M259_9BURK|nr:acyl-CoA dehydrogenase family protein [Achromobacter sp. R39]WMD21086.1 acyl-CoA dehydrogenase family protein [Achromobacter sp. R39]
MDQIFADAAERLFAQTCTPQLIRDAEQSHAPLAAWQACEDAGFADALVPESDAGAGLTLADTLPVVLAAGRHLCPYPIAHTLLARAWLNRARRPQTTGSIALAPVGLTIQNQRITGVNVPWVRVADYVLAQIAGQAWLLPTQAACIQPNGVHGSLDGEASWALADAECISLSTPLDALAAAAYAGLIAGAMDRVLAMTLDYANQRVQFGKPIGRFQAVQQQISVMAEHVWAARMAAQLAFQGRDGQPQPQLAALGKARASQAAPLVADIAHAVHGAIGVTEEYDLQLYTRRLREWRLAGGSESYWHERIGAHALASGTDALGYLRCALYSKESG